MVSDKHLERIYHSFSVVKRANVQKICRSPAAILDKVVDCHGQTGAIDHTADVAIHLDIIVDSPITSLDFQRFLLLFVLKSLNILVPIQGIIVKTEFSVEGQ